MALMVLLEFNGADGGANMPPVPPGVNPGKRMATPRLTTII